MGRNRKTKTNSNSGPMPLTIFRGHMAAAPLEGRILEHVFNTWMVDCHLPHVSRHPNGLWQFPAGLVPELVAKLSRMGCRYEIYDRRRDQCDEDDFHLFETSGADARFLSAINGNFTGLIAANPRMVIKRLDQLLWAFCDGPVLIAASTREVARSVHDRLTKVTDEPIGFCPQSSLEVRERCNVCDFRSVGHLICQRRGVLLVLDATRAIHDVKTFTVGDCAFRRVYGFAYSPYPRCESDDLRLCALFGQCIHIDPMFSYNTHVIMIPGRSSESNRRVRGLQRKRKLIWKNRRRNRMIARVADSLREADTVSLDVYNVQLDKAELCDGNPRVAVLVESTQHAKQFRSLLRDWPLLDCAPRTTRPTTNESTPRHGVFLVTESFAARNAVFADLLVRATGGSSKWLTKQRPTKRHNINPIVIDLFDTFDERARCDSLTRISDYRKQGYIVTGQVTQPDTCQRV